MRIQDLSKSLTGATLYIVGTGPSLRCLPLDWFADKYVLGLNQAYKHVHCNWSITVHPELVVEYQKNPPVKGTAWIVKKKPPLATLTLDDPRYYVFNTSYEIECVTQRPADTLYLGEGIQTTALDLAARMGVKYAVLVGCDAKALGGDFHAHDQHVRWLGMQPEDQYKLYRQTTAAVRAALRPLGVSVLSLSPFIGIDAGEEDYQRLRTELRLPALPPPKDTSAYKRNLKDIRTGAKKG